MSERVSWWRRPDPVLVCLLVLSACAGIVWTVVIPPFQQPDEPDHFVYVDNLARDGGPYASGAYSEAAWHSVVTSKAAGVAHHDRSIGEAGPAAADRVKEVVRSSSRGRSKEGMEHSRAIGYPPAYYASAASAVAARHVVGNDDDLFGDLYLARLVSVSFGVLTVFFAWLAFGAAFGRGQAQLVATGLVALLPMPSFLRSGVNADVLVALMVAVAFWLSIRSLRAERAMSIRGSLVMGLVLGIGVLTKQTFAIIAAGWLVVLLIELLRGRIGIVAAAVRGVVSMAALVATAGWFFVASPNVGVVNGVASGGDNLIGPVEYLRQVSQDRWLNQVNEWWGVYGWLDTSISGDWYRMLKLITLATLVVGVIGIGRALLRRRVDPVVVLALVWTGLWVLALSVVEFNLMRSGTSGPVVQGRYYMPVLVPTILLMTAAWRWLGDAVARPRLTRLAVLVLPLAVAYHAATLIEFLVPRYYL